MTPHASRRFILGGTAVALATPTLLRGAAAQPAPAAAPAIPQAPGFYRFKVGGFTVTTVHDGFFARPVKDFVRNASLEDVQKVLAESFLPAETIRIPFTVTFVETPTQLIAFDAGNGVTPAGATQGRMIENMRDAGIDPAKVTAVIHSHFHGDHVNGLLNASGGAAFPNAEIVVPAAEWAWWSDTGNQTRSPEGQRGNCQQRTALRAVPGQDPPARRGCRGAARHPQHSGPWPYPGHTAYRIADGDRRRSSSRIR
ncbi:MBL fold metallo-hydrolase [Siccirubricoccus deserti]